MFKALTSRIDTAKLFEIQSYQYSEKLPLADTVPANSSKMGRTNISNLGHFYCQSITGHFERLETVAAAIVDDGISWLKGQLIDGSGNRKLFSDYIPLDLWLSPGGVRSPLATNNFTTAPVPTQLFFPIEFEYIFTANSEILLDVKNLSGTDMSYEICFHGIRILSNISVAGISPVK